MGNVKEIEAGQIAVCPFHRLSAEQLIDVEKAVEGRPAESDGELAIKVEDTHCPWDFNSHTNVRAKRRHQHVFS